MIKIRLMGKKEDVHEMIKRIYQIKGIEVMELSDFYTNKGTSKYGRIYMEVEPLKKKCNSGMGSIHLLPCLHLWVSDMRK